MMKLRLLLTSALVLVAFATRAENVIWFDGQHPVTYNVSTHCSPGVNTALDMCSSDMKAVTGMAALGSTSAKATLQIVQLDKVSKTIKKRLASDRKSVV